MEHLPQPIDKEFNELVLTMAQCLMPHGFEVATDAPQTYEALRDYYNETGKIKVWNGASECTIFGYPVVNWAFRAWHDWVHVMNSLEFTVDDEHSVMRFQQLQIIELLGNTAQAQRFCMYLEAEIDGQAEYFQKHGHFPEDQRAFFNEYIAQRKAA